MPVPGSSESRPASFRPPPLRGVENVRVERTRQDRTVPTVYSAPGFLIFIEALWHGNYQQVPVDPAGIDALIEALNRAKAHADCDREASDHGVR